MPVVAGSRHIAGQQLPRGLTQRGWEFEAWAPGGRRAAAGLFLFLIFVLVGCGTSPPTAAIDEPPSVPTPTLIPSGSTAPSVSSNNATQAPAPGAETGPVQDGRPLAARVNGQAIYLDVYERQVAQTAQALGEQGLILEDEQGQAQLVQIRQNVLNGLIEQAMIEQAAATAGVAVTDAELEATVQQSISLGQGQESFDSWLAENDLTMEEFRETQRSQLLAGKMIEYVTAGVPTTAEQVHARHILALDLGKAQGLLDELRKDANFAALAQQASEDTSTAANGGDLGWFPRDAPLMPPSVVEAAFSLQPGDVSDVVESNQGYHIVKVEAREPNRPLTPEILLYVRQQAFQDWLTEQSRTARIERYIDQ